MTQVPESRAAPCGADTVSKSGSATPVRRGVTPQRRARLSSLVTLAGHVLFDCLAVSLVVTTSVAMVNDDWAPAELRVLFAEVWIYTFLIATPGHWLLPRLGQVLPRARPAVGWAAFVGTLAGISAIGAVAGTFVVFALNLEPGMAFGWLLSRSVQLAIVLSVLVGVIHAMVILLTERLHDVEASLRTREIEYERALKLATEARLAALEARIHPHFLFNTLNTISSLIPSAPARAERLVQRLSAVLRFSLDSHEAGRVTLEQELTVVRDYLEIEQARFGPRLRYTLDVPPDLSAVRVPALSVQTLVENSVKYAAAASRDGGDIVVRVRPENGALRIEVSDGGPGFELADLPAGHGLDNLRGRLAALFGREEPLHVEHRNGRTTVSFQVPA